MIYFQKNKLKTFWIVLFLLIAMMISGLAYTQIVTKSDKTVTIAEKLTDMAFFAAEDLNVQIKSTDDIFAAGKDLSITNTIADHLILVGNKITINEVELDDLIMAGGNVELVKGKIVDDIIAAAESLDIESGFTIGDSAMLAAKVLNIRTPIRGDLRAAAETLDLSASVDGNVQLYGETVNIGPNVRIGGDLRYRAETLNMDPSTEIIGTITKLEKIEALDGFEKWSQKALGIIAVFMFAVTFGIVILIAVSVAVFPGLMNGSAILIKSKPLQTIGTGFLIAVAGPVVLMILFASILGIPLALLIGAFYLVVTPLALATSSYFIGLKGREIIWNRTDENPVLAARIIWALLAAFVLMIIGFIPLVGLVVWLVAFITGLGAVVTKGGTALARSAL